VVSTSGQKKVERDEAVGRKPLPRPVQLALGIALGFAWGTVMWLITGAQHGLRLWLYLAISMAMIGGGVAAFFGVFGAARRGERISPRLPWRR
jgi:hypothetical protein